MSILETTIDDVKEFGSTAGGIVRTIAQSSLSLALNFPIISGVALVILASGALIAIDNNQPVPTIMQTIAKHNTKTGGIYWTMEAGGLNAGLFGGAKGEKALAVEANTYCLSHNGYAGCKAVEAGIGTYYKTGM
jgi:hypothetical protein